MFPTAVTELRGATGTAKKIRDVAEWLLRVTEACETVTGNPRLSAVTRISQARLLATAIHLREDITPKQRKQLLSRWEKVSFRIYGLLNKDARTRVGDYVRLAWRVINKQLSVDAIDEAIGEIGEEFPIEHVAGNAYPRRRRVGASTVVARRLGVEQKRAETGMTNNGVTTAGLADAEILWKSADALRGQIDAAEYKHVVLGLLFLKYISDSFEARRGELKGELEADGISGPQIESLLENRDEYIAERVFWVPPEARWQNLQNQAARPDIAKLIDDAILAVERDNPNLKSKLPRDYARRGIAPEKMKELIDLIAGVGFKGDRGKARDTLGRVYEYFLGKFAQAEGKLGGEFFTPRCIVRLLVEMIEPYEGRVYDPCCGSAGMFVQSERFVEAHGGQKTDISIFGQESNPTTWRLAHMNLAIRGIEANLGSQPADSFLRNLHPDLGPRSLLSTGRSRFS